VSSESIPAPHTGVIRVLKFNRPEAKNAISLQLLSELRQEIEQVRSEGDKLETRVLVIGSSVPGVFCAGADLKERKGMTEEQ
jgi:methylglutaconyl-CoA hydratase